MKKEKAKRGSVSSLTAEVKRSERIRDNRIEAQRALAAAEVYVARLVPVLADLSLNLREGRDNDETLEGLAGAVAGMHCLAELLSAVESTTGIETWPVTDQELGRLALGIQELQSAQKKNDTARMSELIEVALLPSLCRLAPSFPLMTAQVASV